MATVRTGFYVLAFEPSGNARVRTPIFVGDFVEWKRQGQRGTVWLKVEQVWESPTKGVKVYARPLTGGRRLTIYRGFHHVVSPEGFDRLSGQKRELPRA